MSLRCLACDGTNLRKVIDFGRQPAANLLTTSIDVSVEREELALYLCPDCGHAQQGSFYSPVDLFSNYLYQSGTSRTLRKYFDWLAGNVARTVQPRSRVLEIASNDGSCLSALAAVGLDCEGVEPAVNIAEISREAGHRVHVGFWPIHIAETFDVIIAQNVAAHTPDPLSFMRGVCDALSEQGVVYIQSSQIDMFENCEFDTLYHEHFSFYCANSKRVLMERAGFPHFYFAKTNVHGGSLLGVFAKSAEALHRATVSIDRESEFFVSDVEGDARPTMAAAWGFAKRAHEICLTTKLITSMAKDAGMQVALVGAAAKAITVLQVAGLLVDRVFDEAPLKIGRFIPGTALQIESMACVREVTRPTMYIIGAWNFRQELSEKLLALRSAHHSGGDVFLCYFPRLVLFQG